MHPLENTTVLPCTLWSAFDLYEFILLTNWAETSGSVIVHSKLVSALL